MSIVYVDFMRAIFITCMKKLTVHVVDIDVNDKCEILFLAPFLPSCHKDPSLFHIEKLSLVCRLCGVCTMYSGKE